MIHGTGMEIGLKIAETGFVSLSSLDAGYYGKGIYFTTNAAYAYPYFSAHENPAIVIAFVIPGNVYPVIESANSLLGQPLFPGYNSHYVLTNRDGSVWNGVGQPYDELVIDQEAQVIPVYVLSLGSDVTTILQEFERQVPVVPRIDGGHESTRVSDESSEN